MDLEIPAQNHMGFFNPEGRVLSFYRWIQQQYLIGDSFNSRHGFHQIVGEGEGDSAKFKTKSPPDGFGTACIQPSPESFGIFEPCKFLLPCCDCEVPTCPPVMRGTCRFSLFDGMEISKILRSGESTPFLRKGGVGQLGRVVRD